MPLLRFEIFTDPMYHAERYAEFALEDVASVEERSKRLFLRGSYRVTIVTLCDNSKHVLRGSVADEIEAARSEVEVERPA